ncbi:MAG: SUF system NifU family Fe-S cluster assembly protein [Subdoligranulum variabile]|uniref:Fe-S cluster assembly sulfur transfer protein SufU n=1 Tax=Gemmiger sp. TaxID=2049027 RepID=UPI002A911DAC|nr:SUF system NifU family Fe-S cluster assembly protein [Gemmiger sp.]MDD7639391.1 SUF system NifU family Fe-S cluster assembly protein [Subdoligranulum variabile]MDY5604999.1 SUF system NifU family Fe-S cluster assembly protein [Gemmiger sp.]
MNLNELYTQIITENSRSKENRHPVPGATHSLEGVNPSCGDDITLQLRVDNGQIEDAGFIGSGCAISQASASLMIDLVKGRSVEDAHRLISLYFQMIKGKITPEELDELEDVAALQGIAHVPARVKCAVLAWHTLEEALDGEGKTDKVTTEDAE